MFSSGRKSTATALIAKKNYKPVREKAAPTNATVAGASLALRPKGRTETDQEKRSRITALEMGGTKGAQSLSNPELVTHMQQQILKLEQVVITQQHLGGMGRCAGFFFVILRPNI